MTTLVLEFGLILKSDSGVHTTASEQNTTHCPYCTHIKTWDASPVSICAATTCSTWFKLASFPTTHWNCPVKVSLFSSCSTSLQLSAPWNHFSSCLLWPLILPVFLWSQLLLLFSLLLSDCLPTFSPPSPALLPEYPGMLCAFLLSIFSSKRNSSLHDCFK